MVWSQAPLCGRYASWTDQQGGAVTAVKYLIPKLSIESSRSLVLSIMDKLYDTKDTDTILRTHNLMLQQQPSKNKELDLFRSGLRMPFEGTFSKQNHHAPYRGHAEVTLQAFMQAPTYN